MKFVNLFTKHLTHNFILNFKYGYAGIATLSNLKNTSLVMGCLFVPIALLTDFCLIATQLSIWSEKTGTVETGRTKLWLLDLVVWLNGLPHASTWVIRMLYRNGIQNAYLHSHFSRRSLSSSSRHIMHIHWMVRLGRECELESEEGRERENSCLGVMRCHSFALLCIRISSAPHLTLLD
jgi:hypothetical protein